MTFEDHYSGHADAYARHRPRYPETLFTWLASVIPGRALAWDAGTGNGQVALKRDEKASLLGIKGVGEVGIVAVSPAIANAIFHATGRRIRELPITPDKVMR